MKYTLSFCLFLSVSIAYTMENAPRNCVPANLSNGWSTQRTLTNEQWAALIKKGKIKGVEPREKEIIKQDGTIEIIRITEEEGCGCIIF